MKITIKFDGERFATYKETIRVNSYKTRAAAVKAAKRLFPFDRV